ncbi:hypothetical protein [Bradyrhizobium japonicum]|uniref:hypothetical protein n=1 Tax=Bradyrhizobium japonicum TaxID=375 RepID=UPI001E65BA4A|nr:hypothetical protein [Bradyrhizobium japonicum]MCD9816652.1 hypothetical protein [Bradyrhizobium japonicum]MEB2670313.1 hypothetical protein [Bradyrhizobium japonicum]WRI89664.1 hypothetical protein R3F75_01505 [Bradyrhizobium japonicum]
MQLIIVTDDADLGQALLSIDPSAKEQDPEQLSALNADFTITSVIAMTLKSAKELPKLARSIATALRAAIAPKPKAKVMFKGPFGQITMEIENVEEAALQSQLEKIFNLYDRKSEKSLKPSGDHASAVQPKKGGRKK